MNPLTKLRDWWLRPVTDRLDRIAAAQQPQFYKVGSEVQVSKENRPKVEELRRRSRVTWEGL